MNLVNSYDLSASSTPIFGSLYALSRQNGTSGNQNEILKLEILNNEIF